MLHKIPFLLPKGYRVHSNSESLIGYAAVIIFVLLSYVVVIGQYVSYTNTVLPHGDPFTYTVGWFQKIDFARRNYLAALAMCFKRGAFDWYRLMNTLIVALSPILAKEPSVICLVNYVVWGLGTVAFFRLGQCLKLGVGRSFAISVIPWMWPVNYGFADYASLPVLGLDAAFTGALILALASSFIFAFRPASLADAIVAGASIGLAVWGRGNSAPVVVIVVAWPCAIAVRSALTTKIPHVWRNIAIAGLIATGMTVEFYWTYFRPLSLYYGVHVQFVEHHAWTLHDAMPYLKNIPGFMYWRSENSTWTMLLSWLSHFVPVMALMAARWTNSERKKAYVHLASAGAFIYFVAYFANLALWNDPHMTIYNSLYIWRPMLLGLSLSLIVLLLVTTDELVTRDLWMLIPIGALMLAWGIMWNFIMTPWELGLYRPGPRTVERVSLSLDQLVGPGPVSVLWYGNWNLPILRYYRLKNDRSELAFYYGNFFRDMWSQGSSDRETVLSGVKEHFANAQTIIIPEYLDDYAPQPDYALYRFKQSWADWLNSSESPPLRVRMLLDESPTVRLLVLQREEVAHGRGDKFRLPYINRPSVPVMDYSEAVIRVK